MTLASTQVETTLLALKIAFLVLLYLFIWRIVRLARREIQEPQIAARHEQRMPIEPSWRSRACRIPSSTERCPSSSTSKFSQ